MALRTSRREVVAGALGTVGLAAAAHAQELLHLATDQKVRIACIGVNGKGDSDSNDAGRLGEVVAICDIDDNSLARKAAQFPNAKKFHDYRHMLEQMESSIDAVTVSVPDHNHGPAAAMAMEMGKHCFCQKPLAHSVYEVRRLETIAREKKVATQMGNQGTASSNLRRAAAQVRKGSIGKVIEVHVWTNRPIWPQGISYPSPAPKPANVHWHDWIGPARYRPYEPGLHPFTWRGFWDFGCGALGDMGCHTMNLPYMALDLRDPVRVHAKTSGNNHESYPKSSVIRYDFAPNSQRGAVAMYWYDGGQLPSAELLPGTKFSSSGSLMIGSHGVLYSPGDYGDTIQYIGGFDVGPVDFPESPGHFEEFIRACQGGVPAYSNFPNYAGPLAETVVLGNLAVWADGKPIEWDSRHMRTRNAPEVESIVHPRFYNGYHV